MADSTDLSFGPAWSTTSLAASRIGAARTVVEMKFGDEETGQAGVEVVASADGVPAGVRIECDQGELLGEQHVRNASGDCRLLSVRK